MPWKQSLQKKRLYWQMMIIGLIMEQTVLTSSMLLITSQQLQTMREGCKALSFWEGGYQVTDSFLSWRKTKMPKNASSKKKCLISYLCNWSTLRHSNRFQKLQGGSTTFALMILGNWSHDHLPNHLFHQPDHYPQLFFLIIYLHNATTQGSK